MCSFVYEVKESISYVGADVFAEWGIIPKYIYSSVFCYFLWQLKLVRSVECIGIHFLLSAFWYGGVA